MAGTSSLSTLFRLWIPNDLNAKLEERAKQSGASKARLIVMAMRETWGVPEPNKQTDKVAQ